MVRSASDKICLAYIPNAAERSSNRRNSTGFWFSRFSIAFISCPFTPGLWRVQDQGGKLVNQNMLKFREMSVSSSFNAGVGNIFV